MPTRCPNCDTPLRDGAKFCSSCGHQLEAVETTPQNVSTQSTAAPSHSPQPERSQQEQGETTRDERATIACPHCGKPNRIGGKFCRFCGGLMTGTKEKKPRSRARVITIVFLVLLILMVCISLLGIAWGLGIDRWLFPETALTPWLGHGPIYWV